MPPGQFTLHSALCPHIVTHPPPRQSIVHFEAVPQLVTQPPPRQLTAQSAEVPQEVPHLPARHSSLQSLDVSQIGWQSSVLQVKSQFFETAHLQLWPSQVPPEDVPELPDVPDVPELPELPDVPELPPSTLPLPIVKSYVHPPAATSMPAPAAARSKETRTHRA